MYWRGAFIIYRCNTSIFYISDEKYNQSIFHLLIRNWCNDITKAHVYSNTTMILLVLICLQNASMPYHHNSKCIYIKYNNCRQNYEKTIVKCPIFQCLHRYWPLRNRSISYVYLFTCMPFGIKVSTSLVSWSVWRITPQSENQPHATRGLFS